MKQIKEFLTFAQTPYLGCVYGKRLLDRFGSVENILAAPKEKLVDVVPERVAESLYRNFEHPPDAVAHQFERIAKTDATFVPLTSDDYPALLREIYDPPLFLFVMGKLAPKDRFSISIVGTRNPTTYGRFFTESIAQSLARHGLTIISGMAVGIDSAAHQGALSAGGRTIAVLGSGVDIIYPKVNKRLYEKIKETGAIVSEFLLGEEVKAENFPRRNRIISGMSLGTLVAEAGERSGALITAKYSLDQGRELFAVPGSPNQPKSVGTNRLVQRGEAKLILNEEDILNEIEQYLPAKESLPEALPSLSELSPEQRVVYQVLSREPKHIDKIAQEADMDPGYALSQLFELELAGVVKQLAGKQFIKI
ncbi:DNA-protecting protein DprA [bacterium]|nr:MAG: DNA-protecting protein DprA [bacterium]